MENKFTNVEFFLLVHIVCSMAIGSFASFYLKERFLQNKNGIFFFMSLFHFSLLFLAYLISPWILYYLKHVRYKETVRDINLLNLDEFETNFTKVERIFGEGSMYELLESDYVSTSWKIKALVSMSDNLSQKNIAIIKQALSNSNDEVRLFSFSIIDKIEREINNKIHLNLERFKAEENPKKKATFAKELALLYWEIIYYGLSEDSLKDFLLQQVKRYIQIAQEYYRYDIKLNAMLGRVYMLSQEYENAAKEFSYIYKMGTEESVFVAPYLAEINFNMGNFQATKSIMNHINGLRFSNTMYPLIEQWRKYE